MKKERQKRKQQPRKQTFQEHLWLKSSTFLRTFGLSLGRFYNKCVSAHSLPLTWNLVSCKPERTRHFCLHHVSRFPSVRSSRSDQSVFKRTAQLHRTGSGQNVSIHGSERLSSPATVGQSAGIWRVLAGKMYARALDLPFKLASTSSFWSARPDEKRP